MNIGFCKIVTGVSVLSVLWLYFVEERRSKKHKSDRADYGDYVDEDSYLDNDTASQGNIMTYNCID